MGIARRRKRMPKPTAAVRPAGKRAKPAPAPEGYRWGPGPMDTTEPGAAGYPASLLGPPTKVGPSARRVATRSNTSGKGSITPRPIGPPTPIGQPPAPFPPTKVGPPTAINGRYTSTTPKRGARP